MDRVICCKTRLKASSLTDKRDSVNNGAIGTVLDQFDGNGVTRVSRGLLAAAAVGNRNGVWAGGRCAWLSTAAGL
jgi:hypothetical protein